MFDVWIGELNLTVFMLVVAVVLVLPVQLLLCFRVKARGLRLLPAALFALLAAAALVMGYSSPGWDGLLYLYGALYAGMMLLMCGIGWGIWALARRKR